MQWWVGDSRNDFATASRCIAFVEVFIMSEPFLGQVMIFGGNFAPRGWAFCQGQLLNISQNTALFAILGTTYGGNGTTNFALPDLRSRVPLGFGQGNGLSNYTLGQTGGSENVALTSPQQLPPHNHMVNADTAGGTTTGPANGNLATSALGRGGGTPSDIYTTGAPTGATQLNSTTISFVGAAQGHPNLQPYLAMNYIIALEGVFPSRN